MKDIRARKWWCRIHKTNKLANGDIYTFDVEKTFNDLRDKYKNVVFCTHNEQEIDEHYHFIIQDENQIRKSTIIKYLPYGFIEAQKGTNRQVIDYMLHIDAKSVKEHKKQYTHDILRHNIENFDEWLDITQGKRSDLDDLIEMVELGASDYQIIKTNKEAFQKYYNFIQTTRRAINENKGTQERESLQVFYYYGDTGTGKSYNSRINHDKNDVFVVSDYKNPWDNYKGQPVLILEEYRSNFFATLLLQILDKYPLELPARYSNNFACWHTVYIVSNIPPQEQYPNIDEATKKAFYRRINEIKHFSIDKILTYRIEPITLSRKIISERENPINSLL